MKQGKHFCNSACACHSIRPAVRSWHFMLMFINFLFANFEVPSTHVLCRATISTEFVLVNGQPINHSTQYAKILFTLIYLAHTTPEYLRSSRYCLLYHVHTFTGLSYMIQAKKLTE